MLCKLCSNAHKLNPQHEYGYYIIHIIATYPPGANKLIFKGDVSENII